MFLYRRMTHQKHISRLKNNEGFNLDAELYLPDTESHRVIVVSTAYGAHIDYNQIYKQFAQNAADAGYHVVLYSFTGTGKSEGSFKDTTLMTQRTDLKTVIDYVRKEIENPHIALLGHSIGASVSIAAFTEDKYKTGNNDIGAIISWNSTLNTQNMYNRYAQHYSNPDNDSYKHTRPLTGETVISGRNMWQSFKDNNQVNNISDVSTPFLAIFSADDELVSFAHAKDALNKLPNKYDCEVIVGSDHEFTNSEARDEVISRTLTWLDTHLK